MAHRVVDASCGPLLVHDDGTLITARGIVYATAERFTAPVPAPTHSDVHDATRRGPACPQLRSRLEFVTGPVVDGLARSEACQVLSVTAPCDAQGLPVMVWFHGGAYMSGGGEAPKYDPDAVAADGRVVVVSVTYRLGIFGYLNPCAGGDGNLGLRDQIQALRWVQRNIAAFGGDPAQVTIFGQSAGGDSVFSLVLSEETTGLFHRAILQSAPLGLRRGREAMTAAMRAAVVDALDDAEPEEAGVERLLEAQTVAVAAAQRFGLIGGLPFAPIEGLDPLPPGATTNRRLAEVARQVEILVGYTRDDAAPFVAMDPRGRRLRRLGLPGRRLGRLAGARMTNRIFGQPARDLAELWTSHGGRAATFRVDWSPPGAPLGACHCIELPLLFSAQRWADAPMLGSRPDPVDTDLAGRVRGYWAAFAHGGVSGLENPTLRI
ncbi:carboxylesterase type B [Mycolicibacterium chubuense NBB4]|uniref:Carboxylic ester hydrolase n=1 Tax=Mycolicibacterium chubuense (strain NBB4) TaxID=710421 RepID=I4BG47_MYCCN|nr:carboxylesterase family protein [Mycolicibacterium chubuense]AFM16254.1 carboxylesterase type B [Mycolicibacterium chubuense NBB4]